MYRGASAATPFTRRQWPTQGADLNTRYGWQPYLSILDKRLPSP